MKAEDIFLAALERKSPAERVAYLDGACGEDAALRAQVEGLLHSHQEAGSFLNAPLFESPPTLDAPAAERPGMQIGSYKLLQQIGEGGFGIVYMAEQSEPVRRRVALKVIKPGMDTRQVIARFEAERQALAVMDHPNIAKVLDAGTTESGRPFFVMELVRGIPITQYCDENSLPIRERLALFATVCQAIQHAHTKGIIHRDIKPTNVLVTRQDNQPAVKVIDFGVAKAIGQQLTDKTLFTDFAQMIGTPLYMSPEQAELSGTDIDTRSDIYSLGVLLYELLTGSTPVSKEQLKQAAFDEIRRIIREDEAQKPSNRISTAESAPTIAAHRLTEPAKLARLVCGELDWIVMKALEKDRSRRYETASGFAADVLHYLSDEAVQACPPSAGYRFRKFARRNKTVLVTLATIAGALIAGIAISTWQAVRATRAEALAASRLEAERKALDQAETAKKVAETNFGRARDVVHGMLTRVAEERVAGVPAMEPVRKALLEDAIQFYEQLLAERNNDPEVRLATAWAHIRMSWVYSRFQDESRREPAIRRALALLEPLVKEYPSESRYRAALASALNRLGHLNAWNGQRWKEAVSALERSVDLWEQLTLEDPDSPEYQRGLGSALQIRAVALSGGQQHEQAEESWRRALSHFELAAKTGQGDNHGLLGTLTSLGNVMRPKDAREAEAFFLRALAVRAEIEKAGGGLAVDSLPTAVGVDLSLAGLYRSTGRPKDAENAFGRGTDRAEKYLADYPGVRINRYHTARAHQFFGDFLFAERRFKEAEAEFRRGRHLSEELVSDAPDKPGTDWWNKYLSNANGLAAALRAQGRSTEAAEAMRQAQEFCAKLAEKHPAAMPNDVRFHHLLGAHQVSNGQADKAIVAYSKAIELSPNHYACWSNRGDAYGALAQWDRAAADYAKAVQLNPSFAVISGRHALLRLAIQDTEGYRKSCAAMLERFHQSPNMDDVFWTAWTCLLGPDAVIHWEQPLELADKALAADPKNYDLLSTLGGLHFRAGRFEEAAKRLAEAEAAFKETKNPRGSIVYNGLFQAMTHHRLGNVEEAKGWLQRAVKEVDQAPPEGSKDAATTTWNRRLTLELLRREAEELLKK